MKQTSWKTGMTATLLALGALTIAPGCGGKGGGAEAKANGKPAAAAVEVSAADKQAAEKIFKNRCTPCHGETGAGDGPASKTLFPRPRNFQDAKWQQSVTDEHIEKIIVGGGASVGKAAAMPPNPDLNGKPGVVAGLRMYVRGLKK